jgi:hypothetical protein
MFAREEPLGEPIEGADAVTAENGICEADHAQTWLKELMARRGNIAVQFRSKRVP